MYKLTEIFVKNLKMTVDILLGFNFVLILINITYIIFSNSERMTII
jgi:hypothetical protein